MTSLQCVGCALLVCFGCIGSMRYVHCFSTLCILFLNIMVVTSVDQCTMTSRREYVVALKRDGEWQNRLVSVKTKEDVLNEAKRVHGVVGQYDIQWYHEKFGLYVTATSLDELPDMGHIRLVCNSPGPSRPTESPSPAEPSCPGEVSRPGCGDPP